MDNRCIAFCDSGIGGLPLLKRVSAACPKENFVYYADSKNMPYGDKTEEELSLICDNVMRTLLSFAPKLIVTACNTLSTFMREHKNFYGVPIVGVFPAAYIGRKGYIICTPNTANSKYVQSLKVDGVNIIAANGLAEEIENALFDRREPNIKKWFDKIDRSADFISLGCTHYEFVSKKCEQMFENAKIIDGSGQAERKIKKFVADFPSLQDSGKVCFIGETNDKIKDIFYNF